MFTLTLAFNNFADLHDATTRLAAIPFNGRIAHSDRPDVGFEPPAPPAAVNPFAVGEVAAVPASPIAPFTAVVAALLNAPGASTRGLPALPVVAPPPAPPNAPGAAAPMPPAAPPSPAGAVALDAAGLPWDARIHAKTKTLNADGTWRRFRGVQEALVVEVEAQLRGSLAATVPPAAAPLPPVPATPLPPTVPAVPPVEVPPAPPAPPAPLALGTFAELMLAPAPHMQSGKVTNLTIAEVLGGFKLANLYQLASVTPDVAAAVGEKFRPYIIAASA